MAQTAFTVSARAGLQGEHDVDCNISDIAVLWEKTHMASKEVITVVKTRDGAQLQSYEPFDAIYAKIQESDETFVDAVSADDENETMYFVNVAAAEVVEGQDDLFVTTKATRDAVFIPMNDRGHPFTTEEFQALSVQGNQADDKLETVM